MSVNDFHIAHLTNEEKEKLRQFENELGCTLIAYEHLEKSNSNETPSEAPRV
ncbi:hypothetical protein [Peribacillus deserti]|uniref:hypothetical protein n=1 Tax=Peribacillus deserti TaxID=673318 RepID=UPI0015E08312|nr:hypothetical protein [Peribacillus deserti]